MDIITMTSVWHAHNKEYLIANKGYRAVRFELLSLVEFEYRYRYLSIVTYSARRAVQCWSEIW